MSGAQGQNDPCAIIGRIRNAFRDVPPATIEQEAEWAIAAVRQRRGAFIAQDDGDQIWEETTRALQRVSVAFADVPVEEIEAEIVEIVSEGRRQAASEFRSA
jgi:hypothetical protein